MKIRCRILDNLNANGALRMAGTEHELDLAEADIEMLIDCRVIQPLDTAADEQMLIGSSVQPAVFDLDGTRYSLGELVVDAQRASGLPAEAWNELPDDEREALIEAMRIRVGAELPVFASQTETTHSALAAVTEQTVDDAAESAGMKAELPPAGGEAKPATVEVLIDVSNGGGELDPVAVNATVATAIDAAKPARKGK